MPHICRILTWKFTGRELNSRTYKNNRNPRIVLHFGVYKSSPCLHPTPTSPSELSSCLHLWAKNTNRLFNTRRRTWNSGTRPFWVQQAHLNSRLWPRQLGEIHTTVPLPPPSKTPAETSYDLKSTCIFVTSPPCFEKGLVIRGAYVALATATLPVLLYVSQALNQHTGI